MAGATVAIDVPVYVGSADGFAYEADATDGTKMPALGFTVSGAADAGYVCHVVIQGPIHYYGGFDLDPGQPVYVAVGGGITQTAPSTAGQVKQRLGWASADEAGGADTRRMIVNPGDAVEVEADVEEVAGSPVSRAGVDISSELQITSVSQIMLTEDAKYQLIFEGTGLAGGGDYGVRATVTRGGATYEVIYDAVVTVSSGVAALYRASDTIALFDGDVVRGYIDGLAGDVSVNVALRVVKMN